MIEEDIDYFLAQDAKDFSAQDVGNFYAREEYLYQWQPKYQRTRTQEGKLEKVCDVKNQEITICVTPEAARVYQSASVQDRQKLNVLLSLQLSGLRKPARPIEDIMREASEEARKNGLTPELLEELLNES